MRPYAQDVPVPGIASAVLVIRPTTAAFVRGPEARTGAASPETCGAAIDVPLRVSYPPTKSVERMSTPGAATSTCRPKSEKDARASPLSVAATESVFAHWVRFDPGLVPALPAATTITAPRFQA